MKTDNMETQNTENNKENSMQNDKVLLRVDSPNVNDNEANKILDKEDRTNESTKLKDNKEKKSKNNSDFFHDKDITEDSIVYFSNKLKTANHNYKFILYISIIVYLIDIILWFQSDKLLHNIYNICAILIILITSLHQAFTFRHDFKSISKELYIFTKKILYIYIAIFIGYIINMLHILIMKFYEIFGAKYIKSQDNFIIMFYIFGNITISSLHLIRLITVKKGIKDLSSAKGEIYENSKIEEVEAINSVIKEI